MGRNANDAPPTPPKPAAPSDPAPRVEFDCAECPGYCCSIYEIVNVTGKDLRRLARHFNLEPDKAKARYTTTVGRARSLKQKDDPILGKACHFLDAKTRRCTIYEARPDVCREYPGRPRCVYYDVLSFERQGQQDPKVLPMIKITFPDR